MCSSPWAKICHLLKMDTGGFTRAQQGLISNSFIAYQGGRVQVLELPAGPPKPGFSTGHPGTPSPQQPLPGGKAPGAAAEAPDQQLPAKTAKGKGGCKSLREILQQIANEKT